MILKCRPFSVGDRKPIDPEKLVGKIDFTVYKISRKEKPRPQDVLIVSCLSEFGCETLAVQYVIPKIVAENPGKYIVVLGWLGREYFYRHLVDEFWEVKQDYQWLRDYCRAFHHESKNLTNLENSCREFGKVIPSRELGNHVMGATCSKCGHIWASMKKEVSCPKCNGTDLAQSMFGDIEYWKLRVTKVPKPSLRALEAAEAMVPPNTVGVFARGRKTYGRNLTPDFYVKLVEKLKSLGFNVLWLGEKQSTQECPVSGIIDLSRSEQAKDLEFTLAVIAKLKFTIQFWTASTRLASMAGVPYLLFESPDQIWGAGHEGYRRKLCDFGPNKLVAAHFRDVCENPDKALDTMAESIQQMQSGNHSDVIMSGSDISQLMKNNFEHKVGT